MLRRCGVLVISALVGGCATSPAYTCPDPSGLRCMSQSEIHAAVENGSIESIQTGEVESEAVLPADGGPAGAAVRSVEPGSPLFIAPEPMRIWFADWRDASDDLHSESYVYIRVGQGTWRIGEQVSP